MLQIPQKTNPNRRTNERIVEDCTRRKIRNPKLLQNIINKFGYYLKYSKEHEELVLCFRSYKNDEVELVHGACHSEEFGDYMCEGEGPDSWEKNQPKTAEEFLIHVKPFAYNWLKERWD